MSQVGAALRAFAKGGQRRAAGTLAVYRPDSMAEKGADDRARDVVECERARAV